MKDAPDLLARLASMPAQAETIWYQLADGALGIESDDTPFRDRFDAMYEECRRPAPARRDAAQVRCTVRTDAASAVALVSFDDPEPLDQLRFALTLFPDRGYREGASPHQAWRVLEGNGVMAFADPHCLVRRDQPWQRFAANLAVSRVLRLQRDSLFFHAAALDVRGRGVLLMGPKGSGKTTLALALAANRHGFLGDETVGLRMPDLDLVPVRRAAFIKPGPAAAPVRAALRRTRLPSEHFPDGTVRLRAHVGRLLGAEAAAPTPLRALVFLRGFGPAPSIARVPAGRALLPWLTPLQCSLWASPPGRQTMRLIQVVSRAACYTLVAGTPDATADLVARTMEEH